MHTNTTRLLTPMPTAAAGMIALAKELDAAAAIVEQELGVCLITRASNAGLLNGMSYYMEHNIATAAQAAFNLPAFQLLIEKIMLDELQLVVTPLSFSGQPPERLKKNATLLLQLVSATSTATSHFNNVGIKEIGSLLPCLRAAARTMATEMVLIAWELSGYGEEASLSTVNKTVFWTHYLDAIAHCKESLPSGDERRAEIMRRLVMLHDTAVDVYGNAISADTLRRDTSGIKGSTIGLALHQSSTLELENEWPDKKKWTKRLAQAAVRLEEARDMAKLEFKATKPPKTTPAPDATKSKPNSKKGATMVAAPVSTSTPNKMDYDRKNCPKCFFAGKGDHPEHRAIDCPIVPCSYCGRAPAGHLDRDCQEKFCNMCLNKRVKDCQHAAGTKTEKKGDNKPSSKYTAPTVCTLPGLIEGTAVRVAADTYAGVNLITPAAVPPSAVTRPVAVNLQGVGGATRVTEAVDACICLGSGDCTKRTISCGKFLITNEIPNGADVLLGMPTLSRLGFAVHDGAAFIGEPAPNAPRIPLLPDLPGRGPPAAPTSTSLGASCSILRPTGSLGQRNSRRCVLFSADTTTADGDTRGTRKEFRNLKFFIREDRQEKALAAASTLSDYRDMTLVMLWATRFDGARKELYANAKAEREAEKWVIEKMRAEDKKVRQVMHIELRSACTARAIEREKLEMPQKTATRSIEPSTSLSARPTAKQQRAPPPTIIKSIHFSGSGTTAKDGRKGNTPTRNKGNTTTIAKPTPTGFNITECILPMPTPKPIPPAVVARGSSGPHRLARATVAAAVAAKTSSMPMGSMASIVPTATSTPPAMPNAPTPPPTAASTPPTLGSTAKRLENRSRAGQFLDRIALQFRHDVGEDVEQLRKLPNYAVLHAATIESLFTMGISDFDELKAVHAFMESLVDPATCAPFGTSFAEAEAFAPPISSQDVFPSDEETGNDMSDIDFDAFCTPEPFDQAAFDKEFATMVDENANLGTFTSETSKQRYRELMTKYQHLYHKGLEGFEGGKLKCPPVHITLSDDTRSVIIPARPMNPVDAEFEASRIVLLEKAGVIERRPEGLPPPRFISPNHIAKRLDENAQIKRRLTTDFSNTVNPLLTIQRFAMPLLKHLLQRRGNRQVALYSLDDGSNWFWQRELDEASRDLTCFMTQKREIWRYKALAMGLGTSPHECVAMNMIIFAEFIESELFTYMDELLRMTESLTTASQTEEAHFTVMERFFECCDKRNARLSLGKAKHFRSEIEILGMVVGKGKYRKPERTCAALRDYPQPSTPKKLNSFIALAQYWAANGFIDGSFAGKVDSLREIASLRGWKKETWRDDVHGTAFRAIRAELADRVERQMVDWSVPFIIYFDYSNKSVALAVTQMISNAEKLVAVASRKTSKAESRYPAAEGEMSALKWSLEHLDDLLCGGHPFSAVGDQFSLTALHYSKKAGLFKSRHYNMARVISKYKFNIYHNPGKTHFVDAFTRNGLDVKQKTATVCALQIPDPGEISPDPRIWDSAAKPFHFDDEQVNDDEVVAIRALKNGARWELIRGSAAMIKRLKAYKGSDPLFSKFKDGADGRLYWQSGKGQLQRQLLYIPTSVQLRQRLLNNFHSSPLAGHFRSKNTTKRIKAHYYWIGLAEDCEDWIAACRCKHRNMQYIRPTNPFKQRVLGLPWEDITIDVYGPLVKSFSGNRFLFNIIDNATGEQKLCAASSHPAAQAASAILTRVVLEENMTPKTISSDNAREFTQTVMHEMAATLATKMTPGVPYHPQSQAVVERSHRPLAVMLTMSLTDPQQRDWDEHLGAIEHAIRAGHKEGSEFSRMFLKTGRDSISPIDRVMQIDTRKLHSATMGAHFDNLALARATALLAFHDAAKERQRRQGERSSTTTLKKGDHVMVEFPLTPAGLSTKLHFKMSGPFRIKRWLQSEKRSALLVLVANPAVSMNVHVDRMIKEEEVPEHLRLQVTTFDLPLFREGAGLDPEVTSPSMLSTRTMLPELADNDRPQNRDSAENVDSSDILLQGSNDTHTSTDIYEVREIVTDTTAEDEPTIPEESRTRYYRVSWVGFGPNDDTWFSEHELEKQIDEGIFQQSVLDDYLRRKLAAAQAAARTTARTRNNNNATNNNNNNNNNNNTTTNNSSTNNNTNNLRRQRGQQRGHTFNKMSSDNPSRLQRRLHHASGLYRYHVRGG